MKRWIAVAVVVLCVGCGGGGGGGDKGPTFEIPGSLTGGLHNYLVGNTILSLRGEVEENSVSGWLQTESLTSIMILTADVLGPRNADVSGVFLDLDGNVSDTSDAIQVGVLSDASGMEFSDDGTVVSLDFIVVNLDATQISFVNSGELVSVTDALPPPP